MTVYDYTNDIISRSSALDAGVTRYFTGKPCINGHTSQRTVKTYRCVVCHSEGIARSLDCNPFARQDAAEKYRRSTKGKAAQARASAKYRRRLRNERDDDSLQL